MSDFHPIAYEASSQGTSWVSVFDALSPDELQRVMQRLRRQRFAARTTIFGIGDVANEILIIESGRVRTLFTTSAGQEYTTGVWSRGYSIGLISAINGKGRILSAEAVDDVTLLSLRVAELEGMMVETPMFARNLMRALAYMASSGIDHATQLATQPVHVRLAGALMALAALPESTRSNHSAEIVGISHEELARLVSATRPWVTRALSDLESRGLIVCYRLRIVIPDMRRLRDVRY